MGLRNCADRSQPHLLDIVHVDAGFDQHAGDELAIDAARAKEVLAGAAQRDVVGEIIAELVEEGDRPRSIGRGVDVELHLAKGEQRSEEHTSELQSLMRISYA